MKKAGLIEDIVINGRSYFDIVRESLISEIGYVAVPSIKVGAEAYHQFLPKGGVITTVDGNTVTVKAHHDGRLYKFNIQNIKIKEDAAGVGIITKQNTTADVGPGTLYKNLKAFGLTEKVPKKRKKKDETV